MGTNWYLVKREMVPDILAGTLQLPYDHWTAASRTHGTGILHIGKSSGGWRFALHVMPKHGIHDFMDWMAMAIDPEWVVINEYCNIINYVELIRLVAYRQPMPQCELKYHTIDLTHCIGHGSGTWDLIAGEFS